MMRTYSSFSIVAIAVLLCLSVAGGINAQKPYNQTFDSPWTQNINVSPDGMTTKIWLDQLHGDLDGGAERNASGFNSKKSYLFGYFSMQMKLVPNNSAGTVATFYMSSQGPCHDEFDFEFLGNVSGQPYILHTNIFVNGTGGREIQYRLPFDPTLQFHKYGFQWNQDIVVFWVDDTPIRQFIRNETATPFPNHQPMKAYASIWDGDTWATQGGRIKIDWADAPFVATYSNYTFNSCPCANTTAAIASCQNSRYAKASAAARTLNGHRLNQLRGVKAKWIKYNYCWFSNYPECQYDIL